MLVKIRHLYYWPSQSALKALRTCIAKVIITPFRFCSHNVNYLNDKNGNRDKKECQRRFHQHCLILLYGRNDKMSISPLPPPPPPAHLPNSQHNYSSLWKLGLRNNSTMLEYAGLQLIEIWNPWKCLQSYYTVSLYKFQKTVINLST